MLLALRYEWIHFLIHTRYRPRTSWSRRLWRNRLRHHFRNERHWYGVTMLAADRLLGTGGDERSVGDLPDARHRRAGRHALRNEDARRGSSSPT
ncbi:MAG: sterol desaturase family protein [Myxococcota bacterium]